MGLKQKIKKTCKSAPALAFGPHAPCCPDRLSRSGQHCSCFYLGITCTEAFFMASSASYPDIRSMAFSRSIVLLLFIIYEYHVIFARSCFNLILILVAWN